jgi:hypothetical protein
VNARDAIEAGLVPARAVRDDIACPVIISDRGN